MGFWSPWDAIITINYYLFWLQRTNALPSHKTLLNQKKGQKNDITDHHPRKEKQESNKKSYKYRLNQYVSHFNYLLCIIFFFWISFLFRMQLKIWCFRQSSNDNNSNNNKELIFLVCSYLISYQWFLISIFCCRHVLSIRHLYSMNQIWMHDFACLKYVRAKEKSFKNERIKLKWKDVLLCQVMNMAQRYMPKYFIIILFIQIWHTMEQNISGWNGIWNGCICIYMYVWRYAVDRNKAIILRRSFKHLHSNFVFLLFKETKRNEEICMYVCSILLLENERFGPLALFTAML